MKPDWSAGWQALWEYRRYSVRSALCLTALGALLSVAACGAPEASQPSWRAVLDDAAIADPAQSLPALTPIAGPRAALVSWKRADSVTGVGATTFARPTWATVAGELKDFCRRYVAENRPDAAILRRRIERLLGLREGDGNGRVVVEFTVETSNVLRPCPDPAVDTTSCPVTYDAGSLNSLLDRDPTAARLLLQQMLTSYVAEGGYPFTRRGYTYDWDPAASGVRHVGLSEYVTRPSSPVEIVSITPIEDYCAVQ